MNMSLMESILMHAIADAVNQCGERKDEETVAAQEIVDMVNQKFNVAKARGVIFLAVVDTEPNAEGDPGIELVSGMAGTPLVLHALNQSVDLLLRQERVRSTLAHAAGNPLADMLAEALTGGSAIQSERVTERYGSVGKTKQ